MTRRIATIGHGDTKNGEALGIPLNDVALGILERQRGRHRTHVFTYRGMPLRNANTRTWRAALRELAQAHCDGDRRTGEAG